MSNPEAGWYPDPTGQPHIIRFWDGTKWTNKTQREDPTDQAPTADGSTEGGVASRPDEQPTEQQWPNQQTWTTEGSAQQQPHQPPYNQPQNQQAWGEQPYEQASWSQQPWGQQAGNSAGNSAADAPAWSADPQPWGADQFTSYDQPDAEMAQPQAGAHGGQAQSEQQAWAGPDYEQTQQQPWSGQQFTDPANAGQAWSAEGQPWGADQFSTYEPAESAGHESTQQPTEAVRPLRPVSQEQTQSSTTQQSAQADSAPVRDTPAISLRSVPDAGGWWQPSGTPEPWDTAQPDQDAAPNSGPRLRAVSPGEYAQPTEPTHPPATDAPAEPTERVVQPAATHVDAPEQPGASNAAPIEAEAGPTPAELARATWGAPELAPAPPEHWTQREISEYEAAQAAAPQTASGEAARVADLEAADDVEVSSGPDWGSQAGDDEENQQAGDVPAWGVEASPEDEHQAPENEAPLWTVPTATDAAPDQPVQLWGDQTTAPDNQAASAQQSAAQPVAQTGQVWGSQQGTAADNNGWGEQQSGIWANQPTADQNGHDANQVWGGQTWPLQDNQATSEDNSGWGSGQQAGQGSNGWGSAQQSGPQAAQQGTQPWDGQQGVGTQQRAWGDDGNAAWGGQTDLSAGVGKRDNKSKKSKGSSGGGSFGAKLPLVIGGGIALVLLIVAAVVLITNKGDQTAGPDPTGTTTQNPSPTPTDGSTVKPGQSRNPKLHEGAGRISSDAISFPRRNPPWSDHKLFVPQVHNAGGQRIVLQQDAAGTKDDWSADIFVGGLGTGSGFDGDPKATAAKLSTQLQTSMYGNIPATYQLTANAAVKRSGKSGWFYQQLVTVKATTVPHRVLTLTVAVFDLGDGTAVAYVSGIPNDRPDLKTAADEAYEGIQVG